MWRGFADGDWTFFGDSHTVLNKIRQFLSGADSHWLHIDGSYVASILTGSISAPLSRSDWIASSVVAVVALAADFSTRLRRDSKHHF
jgi:hypothetical protein